MNKVIINGRLGQEPAVSITSNGQKRASFAIANDEHTSNGNVTNWIDVVCFGKTAEIVESHIHTGDKIIVEGRLSARPYTDKEGKNRKLTTVAATRIEFEELKSKRDVQSPPSNPAPESNPADGFVTVEEEEEEYLPFQ